MGAGGAPPENHLWSKIASRAVFIKLQNLLVCLLVKYFYKYFFLVLSIAVRLRGNKKVQNLNNMWYKESAKHIAT
jgi:hypothetical protein